MSSTVRAIAAIVGGALLTVGLAAVSAQADLEWGTDPAAVDVECATTQCLLGRVPVRGAPFSAVATIVWRPSASAGLGEQRAEARYLRDGEGRVRIERSFAGSDGATRQILLTPDADRTSTYVLDPVQRTQTRVPLGLAQMMAGAGGHSNFILPLSSRRFLSFWQTPKSLAATGLDGWEPLGERYISGVAARGTGLTMALPVGAGGAGYAERWVSDELNLVLYSRSEDVKIGTFEYQVTKISRTEPPAGTFDLPAGYEERPIAFPLTFVNPYKPAVDRRAAR
jgi:hypothetical protein